MLAGSPAYEAASLPAAIAKLKELVAFAMLPNERPRDRKCWNAIRKAISDEVVRVGTYGLDHFEDSKFRYAFRLEYAGLCLSIAPNFAQETSSSTEDPIVDRPGWIKAIGLAICRFCGWVNYVAELVAIADGGRVEGRLTCRTG